MDNPLYGYILKYHVVVFDVPYEAIRNVMQHSMDGVYGEPANNYFFSTEVILSPRHLETIREKILEAQLMVANESLSYDLNDAHKYFSSEELDFKLTEKNFMIVIDNVIQLPTGDRETLIEI